jgi:hypothetical protein
LKILAIIFIDEGVIRLYTPRKMSKETSIEKFELAAFRLPSELREEAQTKAKKEDLTFSQLMRRAIRKELEQAAPPPSRRRGK